MARTEMPAARETDINPADGAENKAVPQIATTRQNVPINSAARALVRMVSSCYPAVRLKTGLIIPLPRIAALGMSDLQDILILHGTAAIAGSKIDSEPFPLLHAAGTFRKL